MAVNKSEIKTKSAQFIGGYLCYIFNCNYINCKHDFPGPQNYVWLKNTVLLKIYSNNKLHNFKFLWFYTNLWLKRQVSIYRRSYFLQVTNIYEESLTFTVKEEG